MASEKAAQRGAVAMLQEFVQCSKEFAAPQHRAILQWSYDQRIASATSLHFRATVAFLLDRVPHHVAGDWQPSKKWAQRDVAERALRFFVGRWGEQLMNEEGPAVPEAGDSWSDVRVLEGFCRAYSACGGQGPKWTHRRSGREVTAHVELRLLGVAHKFAGATLPTKEAANEDAARRILWYLQCPGYETRFSPDPCAAAVTEKRIPEPPANWACSGAEAEDLRRAERKTSLMRVQNRLQQALARKLKPGEGVWEWSYELDRDDTKWPPLYRATVSIPGLDRAFVGDWARGQREAQVEASLLVGDFLDGLAEASPEEPSTRSGSVEGSGDECVAERTVRWADLAVEDEDEDGCF